MDRRIIIFNLIYYAIPIGLILASRQDQSGALGYGYFIAIFWVVALVLLIVLLIKKKLRPRTWVDKLGIVTATPVLPLIFFAILLSGRGDESSYYYNKDNHRYKEVTTMYGRSRKKRIEYYRNATSLDSAGLVPDKWMKDCVVVYRDGKRVDGFR